MTGNLKIAHEALTFAATDIRHAALDIEECLAGLAHRMEGRRSEWTGTASDAFTDARMAWDRAMQDMKSILSDIAVSVGISNEEYQQAEAANAGRFAR